MVETPRLLLLSHILVVLFFSSITTVSALTQDDFLVVGLDEVDPVFASFDGEMHAGLLSIDPDVTYPNEDTQEQVDKVGKLMFWLFEPDRPLVDDSLVIWFNGGPGCSSFHAGLFLEMGPITTPLQPAGSFGQTSREPRITNQYAWTNVTAVMYIEQPVGTGFSYGTDLPTREEEIGRDFYNFMLHFNQLFPQHATKRVYLVGESYAGYYAPSMAHYVYLQNKQHSKKGEKYINLHGLALGNGWAEVETQGPAVIDYAYWHGMIDSVTRDIFHREWEHCIQRTGSEPEPFHPFTTPDECGMMEAVLQATGAGLLKDNKSPNTYDVTTWDKYLLLTETTNTNTLFFNDPKVREKLHVTIDREWAGCMPGAGRRRRQLRKKERGGSKEDELLPGKILLKDDEPLSMAPYLADLLDDGHIQVLVYNGDRDLSTCAQGSETMLNNMDWSGHEDWLDPHKYRRALWLVDEYPAGWAKSVQNLEFVVVYNSGHLVPYNVPIQALDLVHRLVTKTPFGDVDIPMVLDPAALPPSKSHPQQQQGNSGWLFPALVGFVAGIVAAFVHKKYQKQRQHKYEQVGDIPM